MEAVLIDFNYQCKRVQRNEMIVPDILRWKFMFLLRLKIIIIPCNTIKYKSYNIGWNKIISNTWLYERIWWLAQLLGNRNTQAEVFFRNYSSFLKVFIQYFVVVVAKKINHFKVTLTKKKKTKKQSLSTHNINRV